MNLFGHMGTGVDLGTVHKASEAQTAANSARQKVAELEERLDKLTLVCAALWELLREKTGLTEQDLAERVAMVDARDGVADGAITRTVRPCAKCGRPVAARHRTCLYCGAQQPMTGVFDVV